MIYIKLKGWTQTVNMIYVKTIISPWIWDKGNSKIVMLLTDIIIGMTKKSNFVSSVSKHWIYSLVLFRFGYHSTYGSDGYINVNLSKYAVALDLKCSIIKDRLSHAKLYTKAFWISKWYTRKKTCLPFDFFFHLLL